MLQFINLTIRFSWKASRWEHWRCQCRRSVWKQHTISQEKLYRLIFLHTYSLRLFLGRGFVHRIWTIFLDLVNMLYICLLMFPLLNFTCCELFFVALALRILTNNFSYFQWPFQSTIALLAVALIDYNVLVCKQSTRKWKCRYIPSKAVFISDSRVQRLWSCT